MPAGVVLRDYQETLRSGVFEQYELGTRAVMVQLVTGGGKTEIGIDVAREFIINGRPVIWITHKQELCEQTASRFIDNGLMAKYYTSNTKEKPTSVGWNFYIQIMSPIMFRNYAKNGLIPSLDDPIHENALMIFDEAHHATSRIWSELARNFTGKILGLTATPWRLERGRSFTHLFETLLCGPQMSELIPEYLPPVRVHVPPNDALINRQELSIRSTGDYDLRSLDNNPFILALRHWRDWAGKNSFSNTIFYMPTSRSARRIAVYLKEQFQMNVGLLLSDVEIDAVERESGAKSPADAGVIVDRHEVVQGFRSNTIDCIVNCEILTEGFDSPGADCIVVLRPTKSLALYLQMIGRGMRKGGIAPHLTVMDFAKNFEEHGLPDENREWTLKARPAGGSGDSLVKLCGDDECRLVNSPSAHFCIFCGWAFGKECPSCKWAPWNGWTHTVLSTACPVCNQYVAHRCSAVTCPGKRAHIEFMKNIEKGCPLCGGRGQNPFPDYCNGCLHGEILNVTTKRLAQWRRTSSGSLYYKENDLVSIVRQNRHTLYGFFIVDAENNKRVIHSEQGFETIDHACNASLIELRLLLVKRHSALVNKRRRKNFIPPSEQSYQSVMDLFDKTTDDSPVPTIFD